MRSSQFAGKTLQQSAQCRWFASRHCYSTCNPREPRPAGRRLPIAGARTQDSPAPGKCWLVGAGPGTDDYLTIKAMRLLQEADVVVYDELGAQSVLQHARDGAELVYVGKRGGRDSIRQPQIDEMLVELCKQGRHVVRLKGGCPAVFSRVASEVRALAAAGVQWGMVPGVSSVLAAPVLAGFPLTDALLSTSFAVTSGHDVEGTAWAAFSQIPTLVILMAGRNLAAIREQLLQHGWAPDTPVAIIRAAGTPAQREWWSDLAGVLEATAGEELSPCITVVGQVARQPAATG